MRFEVRIHDHVTQVFLGSHKLLEKVKLYRQIIGMDNRSAVFAYMMSIRETDWSVKQTTTFAEAEITNIFWHGIPPISLHNIVFVVSSVRDYSIEFNIKGISHSIHTG